MAKLVTKFKYLKPNQKKSVGGYAKYIATRDGVEKIDKSQRFAPATTQQKQFIEKLIKDFPDSKEMFEYSDYINRFGLSLPVINELTYPNLNVAPCRYKGSAYNNDLIIAAHNYYGHFGRLRELQINDEIRLIDMNGNVFKYIVTEFEEIDGKDVSTMSSGEWDLTLFTCTWSGMSRVTIRCKSIKN